MKRILVVADLHCGHVVGLTPPDWQRKKSEGGLDRTKRAKYAELQRECWDWYSTTVDQYKPFDLVICNGDAIDGRGQRSGGTELLVADRHDQCNMACSCLKRALSRKTKLVMTYGTPYHTGSEEDWEGLIASDLNAAKIGAHEWVTSDGVTLDVKHKCSGSSVPHGRYTAIARDAGWSLLWAERALTPRADVVIRSHVHYHVFCGDHRVTCFTTPALQAMGSKYGARQCSGIVDFGFVVLETDKGEYEWDAEVADLKSEVAKAIVLTDPAKRPI